MKATRNKLINVEKIFDYGIKMLMSLYFETYVIRNEHSCHSNEVTGIYFPERDTVITRN
jgi:hypothetical protein